MNEQLQRALAELQRQVAELAAELERRPAWEDYAALERRVAELETAPAEDYMASNTLHINEAGEVE